MPRVWLFDCAVFPMKLVSPLAFRSTAFHPSDKSISKSGGFGSARYQPAFANTSARSGTRQASCLLVTSEEVPGRSEKRIMSSILTLLVATLARRGGVRAMGQTVPAIRNEVPHEILAHAN